MRARAPLNRRHPMAAPMRDSPLDGHRAKVADPRTAAKADANFEYDDNEWDVGIGDLIIDLDADIEKTNERTTTSCGGAGPTMASTGGGSGATAAGKAAKLSVEHSATVDKGLKMKIKRTKPGTKTSEAKHEIVKTGEQNGGEAGKQPPQQQQQQQPQQQQAAQQNQQQQQAAQQQVQQQAAQQQQAQQNQQQQHANNSAGNKRGSSGSHRRDKARDKPKTPVSGPAGQPPTTVNAAPLTAVAAVVTTTTASTASTTPSTPDVNGIVRPAVQRVVFPAGPGPPNAPGPPPSPSPPAKNTPSTPPPPPPSLPQNATPSAEESPSPASSPPPKKPKPSPVTETKVSLLNYAS